MAQPHLEVFPSEFHMLQFFGKYLPKLDVMQSGRLGPYLYNYDGNLVFASNLFNFLTQMEELTGLGIDVRSSVQKGKAYLLFFSEKPKDPSEFVVNSDAVSVKEATITEPKVEMVIPVSTEVVNDNLTEVDQPVKTEFQTLKEQENKVESSVAVQGASMDLAEAEQKENILKEAESLRDENKKAASKSALEQFAMKHNVSLSKAKTFDGMLEDLKAAL